MSRIALQPNGVKIRRLARGWSQSDLAERAGISRAAVSAVENQRLVPSVAAALALARTLECTVEELFAAGPGEGVGEPRWAWLPSGENCRFWRAAVDGQVFLYPVEATAAGEVEHDGVYQSGELRVTGRWAADETLVIACCDPAAAVLADHIQRLAGVRALVLFRASKQALELLGRGVVHAAGVHLATCEFPEANCAAVRACLGTGYRLLRVARWQEGVALSPGVGVRSVRAATRARLRWVAREPGSGARQCLDGLLGQNWRPRHCARDHRGVAEAIRSGWADAGVCVRLVSEEAGLRFLPVQEEIYELCIACGSEEDRRFRALQDSLRSADYRRVLTDLPGYDARECGDMRTVG